MSEITTHPLHWPPQWPREHNPERNWRFDTTISKARNEIYRQIQLLGGTDIVISSNAELLKNGEISGRQRHIEDTGVAAYFKLNGKLQCIPCDKWDILEHNMWSIAKTIDAIRGIERWGSKHMIDAAMVGFDALPQGAITVKRNWREVFGVDPADNPTTLSVKAYFIAMAKSKHPDVGGDPDEWLEIVEAHNDAMNELRGQMR